MVLECQSAHGVGRDTQMGQLTQKELGAGDLGAFLVRGASPKLQRYHPSTSMTRRATILPDKFDKFRISFSDPKLLFIDFFSQVFLS